MSPRVPDCCCHHHRFWSHDVIERTGEATACASAHVPMLFSRRAVLTVMRSTFPRYANRLTALGEMPGMRCLLGLAWITLCRLRDV